LDRLADAREQPQADDEGTPWQENFWPTHPRTAAVRARNAEILRMVRVGASNVEIRVWLREHGYGSLKGNTISKIVNAGLRRRFDDER
jgi:hypothetical protein